MHRYKISFIKKINCLSSYFTAFSEQLPLKTRDQPSDFSLNNG